MQPDLPLFNLRTRRNPEPGRFLRDAGITRVTANNSAWVMRARELAKAHAREYSTVTADDIHQFIADGLLDPMPHPNCAGGIWKDRAFRFTGVYINSTRAGRHAGLIRTWGLR